MQTFINRLKASRWSFEGWLRERCSKQGPEKKAEWVLQRLYREIPKIPVNPQKGRILVLAVEGGAYHLLCQLMMALRLRLEGHHVEIVKCIGELPACMMGTDLKRGMGVYRDCEYCNQKKNGYIRGAFPCEELGASDDDISRKLSEVDGFELDECLQFVWQDIPIGEYCDASVKWILRRAHLGSEDVVLFREYLKGGLRMADRFGAHLERVKPDAVVIYNGEFFADRIARALCERNGIKYICHEAGYLPNTLYVSENGSGASVDVADTYSSHSASVLSLEQEERVKLFFSSRLAGPIGVGGKVFWPSIQVDKDKIVKELGLDARPFALAFTNVTWDTAVVGRDHVFRNLLDWLAQTVEYFRNHPEWQFVIRCHPSEVRDEGRVSQDRVELMLPQRIVSLPENVRLIPSDSSISSYVLMQQARCGLAYTSTAGMEMVAQHKMVILAGLAHYSNKGFTCDPQDVSEYFSTLSELMNEEQVADESVLRALYQYAHHFFYERMIPFEPVELVPGTCIGNVVVKGRRALMKMKGLGRIVSMLSGESAVLDAK